MLASEQFLGIRPDRPQRVQPIRHLRPGIRQRLERTDHGHAGHVWCHVFIVILVASKPHSHSHHPPYQFPQYILIAQGFFDPFFLPLQQFPLCLRHCPRCDLLDHPDHVMPLATDPVDASLGLRALEGPPAALREAGRIGPGERDSLTTSARRQQYGPDAPALKCCYSFCSIGMSDSMNLLDEPPTLASSAAAVVGLLVDEEMAASFRPGLRI